MEIPEFVFINIKRNYSNIIEQGYTFLVKRLKTINKDKCLKTKNISGAVNYATNADHLKTVGKFER